MPDTASVPMLEVDHVSKRYGSVRAVDDVSFSVAAGEFLTLLGPSGCGKTTVLRMIAGFVEPSAGSVRIAGRAMGGVRPYDRQIGIVFQNLALFPHMTVGQNVAFGLEVRRRGRDETARGVADALALVGLDGFASRRIHELSGGQRQRVALARALVVHPSVLLLDEPLGALDLRLRRQMQAELKQIQRRLGTTFVLVTHDQEEALTMSDRIAVLNHGRIEQIGTGAEIYARPTSLFVARFIGDTNILSGRVAACDRTRVRIEIGGGLGAVEAIAASPPVPGSMVSVSVRPEDVLLGQAAEQRPWCLRGRVGEVVYAGAQMRCTVLLDGAELQASLPARLAAAANLAPDVSISLSWHAEDAWLLPGTVPSDAHHVGEQKQCE
ncbi:MAG: ABC transporter ATP-binding protein [Acetobacteraceae bacterium]